MMILIAHFTDGTNRPADIANNVHEAIALAEDFTMMLDPDVDACPEFFEVWARSDEDGRMLKVKTFDA